MKEILVRTGSGILYISIIIFSMFASREWFLALFFILATITLYEFLRLLHLKKYIVYTLLGAGIYFLSYEAFNTIAIYVFLIAVLAVNLMLIKDTLWIRKSNILEKNKYIPIIFYLIGGFIFLTLIPYRNEIFEHEIIIGVFVLVWANDTFAYIIGSRFGKHKLLKRVSPKKTVEGFLGGLIGSIIASFIIFNYSQVFTEIIWVVLAILISVFGTIGDLIQSKFKRLAGVKDSGILMPGHGGLYDRLDSIVFASPFVYTFLKIVDYVS